MCKNLDSPHPLTPSPKDGILLTRIMSPLSQRWRGAGGEGKNLSLGCSQPICIAIIFQIGINRE
jgi:hypothetical protein